MYKLDVAPALSSVRECARNMKALTPDKVYVPTGHQTVRQ